MFPGNEVGSVVINSNEEFWNATLVHTYTSNFSLVKAAANFKDVTSSKSVDYYQGFWCHGLSLMTFYRFGYSIFDNEMYSVLRDDFINVSRNELPKNKRRGLLACWVDRKSASDVPFTVKHSARVVFEDENEELYVLSKSGIKDVPKLQSITRVQQEYRVYDLVFYQDKNEKEKLIALGGMSMFYQHFPQEE